MQATATMARGTRQLTRDERKLYDRCLETISAGMSTAEEVLKALVAKGRATQIIASGKMTTKEVGAALGKIKDGELYKELCESWAEFVRRNLTITLRHADRLVQLSRPKDTSLDIGLGIYAVSTEAPKAERWENSTAATEDGVDVEGEALEAQVADEPDEAPKQPARVRTIAEQFGDLIARFRKLAPRLTTAQDLVMHLDAMQLLVDQGELVPEVSA